MTLDDAIAHAREVAAGCGECAEEHAQLADWLDELRALKALKEDGEAMSMLGEQIKELREAAEKFEGYQCGEVSRMMREAADAIESLRDRLQELQGVGGESRYTALFGTPERAVRTMVRTSVICDDPDSYCDECPLLEAPSCSSNLDNDDYDALLGWLKGNVPSIDEPDAIRNGFEDDGMLRGDW